MTFASLAVLVLVGCGGDNQSAKSPGPSSTAADKAPSEAPAEGSSDDTLSGHSSASRPRVTDPEALEKHVELVRSMGALVGVSSSCSLLALKQFKHVAGRDLLYMLTGVHPDNANGPGPLCTVQVFSPTEQPSLQWNVTIAAQAGDKPSTERKRPETFRPPNEVEATRLAAILAAFKTTKGRGLMVPTTIAAPDGWLVYLMRYSDHPDTLALGPHYRIFVSIDGKTVTKTELLSDGEDISLIIEGGQRVDALKIPFDKPVPNEAHTFMSVMARMPLIVKTDLGGWLVTQNKIELIEPAP